MRRRLQVILAHAGIASRRKAAEIIQAGRVRINGIVVREKGVQFDPEEVRIEIDGRPVQSEKKVYYLLNKPKGIITTSSDEKGRRTVLDLVPETRFRIYPVGRLDKDTEGALILTNDGNIAHRLTHPRFGVKKVYTADVKRPIKKGGLARLEKGIYLDKKKTAPCKISIIKKRPNKIFLSIELHEGRKRQIRRMMEMIGASVLKLRRVSYAGIDVRNLPIGKCRMLKANEVKLLKESCLL